MASFHHVKADEDALMKTLHGQGLGIKKIAKLLGRGANTVSEHVFKHHSRHPKRPVGRPPKLNEAKAKKIVSTHAKMLAEAKGKHEVTLKMVKSKMRLKCSERTISRSFAAQGIRFRPLYEKPDLSDGDKKERLAFAKVHEHRTAGRWATYPHAVIDNKVFPVYLNGKARDFAARRSVRGAYRGRAAKLDARYTKPSRTLKQNTGKNVMICCAIGAGKVLMWHEIKGRWNAGAAVNMYTGPLLRSLKEAYPTHKRAWRVMEDNDPSGYKASKAIAAKKEARIVPLSLPRRSPDLNPLDYTVWAEINRRMRKQESSWPSTKKESRAQYLCRLRRTAVRLPSSLINAALGNMECRCGRLIAARGGHFSEGGSSSSS